MKNISKLLFLLLISSLFSCSGGGNLNSINTNSENTSSNILYDIYGTEYTEEELNSKYAFKHEKQDGSKSSAQSTLMQFRFESHTDYTRVDYGVYENEFFIGHKSIGWEDYNTIKTKTNFLKAFMDYKGTRYELSLTTVNLDYDCSYKRLEFEDCYYYIYKQCFKASIPLNFFYNIVGDGATFSFSVQLTSYSETLNIYSDFITYKCDVSTKGDYFVIRP